MFARMLVFWLMAVLLSISPHTLLAQEPGEHGPFEVGSITVITTNPDGNSRLETEIYFPAVDGKPDVTDTPYPLLIFARGFLSNPGNYPGNGQHLASWGYIVAIPDFPSENIEQRSSDVQHIIDYMLGLNDDSTSEFYGQLDTNKVGLTGHSLGGLSALMASSRDSRVKAVVALDPANPPFAMGGPWDYEAEAKQLLAPTLILGAPGQICNVSANYRDIFPAIGADHKAQMVLSQGSHCDFMDTDSVLERDACYLLCGGTYNADRVQLVERYSLAWFDYYLRGDSDYFDYLYGEKAQDDVANGLLTAEIHTAPQAFTLSPDIGGVRLSWRANRPPVIHGYRIYRRDVNDPDPISLAKIGTQSSYTDWTVVGGTEYLYKISSTDAAGNEHQPSAELSAIPDSCRPYDFVVDGIVDLLDILEVVNRWQDPESYELKYDVSPGSGPDGVIDIADIMAVVVLYGQECP